jgi:hypothetical protein
MGDAIKKFLASDIGYVTPRVYVVWIFAGYYSYAMKVRSIDLLIMICLVLLTFMQWEQRKKELPQGKDRIDGPS